MKQGGFGSDGCLLDLAGLQTFAADPKGAARAVHEEQDTLEVRKETARGYAGNLFSDASLFLRHSSSGKDATCDRPFTANIAYFSHDYELPKSKVKSQSSKPQFKI